MEDKLDIILERLDELKQSQVRFEKNQKVFTEKLDCFGGNQEVFAGKLDRFEGNQKIFADQLDCFEVKLNRFEGNQDLLAENQKNFGEKLDNFGLGQGRIERKLDDSITEMRSGFNQVRSKQRNF